MQSARIAQSSWTIWTLAPFRCFSPIAAMAKGISRLLSTIRGGKQKMDIITRHAKLKLDDQIACSRIWGCSKKEKMKERLRDSMIQVCEGMRSNVPFVDFLRLDWHDCVSFWIALYLLPYCHSTENDLVICLFDANRYLKLASANLDSIVWAAIWLSFS